MIDKQLVEIHQEELRSEADWERRARAARTAQTTGQAPADRRPSIAARVRDLGRLLRRPRPATGDRSGAI